MTRWFGDTLSKRLLLLMWAALVGSHLLAFAAVRLLHAEQPDGTARSILQDLPTLPSLPPTPGIPGAPMARGGPRGDGPPAGTPNGPGPGGAGPGGPLAGGAPALPWGALLLDYGVRFAVIAAAAWFGSRWLAKPVQRLVAASGALGSSIAAGAALPTLDEHTGTREVREAASVFNTMAGQLREQFQARGLMVAAISHDLRTPLTRLRLRLEAMGEQPPLQQRSIADVEEMDALIDNVLDVFRPPGAGGERLQQTDVAALVQSIADDLAEQGRAVGFDGRSVVAPVMPMALRRAVGNLVANALRYGERADVRVESTDAEVSIVVEDDGPGIPPAELEAVLQPFYRIDASRNRHTGGAGLGLYIARDLVERQGGQLRLGNRRGGGLRAEVVLVRKR